MIQFNLLPEVKLQFIKARRLKRMMTLVSLVIVAVSLLVLTLEIISVDVVQKHTLNTLNHNIMTASSDLKSVKDLSKILTVQNQISTLNKIHTTKPVGSRLFGYLAQLTPQEASISKLGLDFTKNTITITGSAPRLDVVNTYTDTLKAATYGSKASVGDWLQTIQYKTGDVVHSGQTYYAATADNTADKSHQPGVGASWSAQWKVLPNAFSSVVLSAFTRDSKGASYTIIASFNPEIFSDSHTVTLAVPAGPTVDPAVLFQPNIEGTK